jgi:deoxyribonuclease IV
MKFGVHVGIGKGFAKAIDEAKAAGCDCIQIFAGNPRAFRLGAYDAKAWDEFRRLRAEHGIGPVVIHTSYLINLATASKNLHSLSEQLVAHDLEFASKAGIEYVNTHLGSYGAQDRAVGFRRVCDTIRRLVAAAPPGPMLLLENSAGAGNLCGGTLEEIGAILKTVGSPRVGICVDSAHAWASGYDLASEKGFAEFLRSLKRHVGLRRVRALHVNDTQVELGAKRDRHWHVAEGRIGAAGFRRLLTVPGLQHAAAICETPKTPKDDARNVAMVRRLAGAPARAGRAGRGTPTSGQRDSAPSKRRASGTFEGRQR